VSDFGDGNLRDDKDARQRLFPGRFEHRLRGGHLFLVHFTMGLAECRRFFREFREHGVISRAFGARHNSGLQHHGIELHLHLESSGPSGTRDGGRDGCDVWCDVGHFDVIATTAGVGRQSR